jgi:hypothetical protein
MYFPRNREFGSALSILRNFVGEGGGGGLNPPRYATGPNHLIPVYYTQLALDAKTDPIPNPVDLKCIGSSSFVTWPSALKLCVWVRVTHHYAKGAASHYSLIGVLCDVQKRPLIWRPEPPACDLVSATKLFVEVSENSALNLFPSSCRARMSSFAKIGPVTVVLYSRELINFYP